MSLPLRDSSTATESNKTSRRRRRWLSSGLVVLALGAAACDPTDGVLPGPFDPVTGNTGGGFLNTATLDAFAGCDELLTHIKAEAAERVGPYGIEDMGGGRVQPFLIDDAIEPIPADGPFQTTTTWQSAPASTIPASAEQRADAPAAPTVQGPLPITDGGGEAASDADFSETNNQESGVDEPDLVKIDGRRMVVVRDGELRVYSLLTPAPSLLGVFDIPGEVYTDQMFLYGDKVLVMSTDWRESSTASSSSSRIGYPYAPRVPHAVIQEINIANPARINHVGTLTIDGTYLSARMIGGVVRLVVEHAPDDLGFVFPSGRDTSVAERANREVVQNSTLDQWLAEYTLERNGRSSSGAIAPCNQVHEPSDFSGFNTTTVLTVNLSEGLSPGNGVSVLADGQMVYASANSLFLATNEWARPNMAQTSIVAFEENYRTDLHKFSISNRGAASYQASGSVAGHALNQFSLSEHEGNLRIATTEGAPWGRSSSSSSVFVLEQKGAKLNEIGGVGGLGKGERIQSVRFVGDRGYVVTFRQIDPLYVVDLSNPSNPSVTGELKIPGFSSYLHPIEGDQLIGIGRDINPNTGRDNGLQISLFDVSNPANPRRTANRTYDNAYSDAQWNHRAVTWWEDTDNLIIPIRFEQEFDRPIPLPFPDEPIPVEPFPVDSPGGTTTPQTTIPMPTTTIVVPPPDFAPRPYEPDVGAAVLKVTPSSIQEQGIIRHDGFGDIDRSIIHNGRLITLSWSGVGTHQLSDLRELGWLPHPNSRR